MKIIRADNGAYIDVNFPSNATVDHIKQKVYENYNIPVDQQILLCEGTKLPAQKTFAELGLTQDKQIFLYDKRQLGIDSAPPSETYYEIPLINLPEQPVFVPNAADPVHVRNLKQYEQKFTYQYNIAKAILDSSDASLRLIIQSHFEQQNQLAAIRSAIANLNDYDKKLLQIFDPFTEYVSRKQDEHDKLFKSMDSTLQKLRETKLDPALCDDNHKALIDFIPVDKLRDWAKRCKEQDDLLRWKFSELTRSIRELDQNVKLETDRQTDFDIKQQQETLKSSSNKVEEVKAITSAFWNDLQKLQNVLKVTMQSGGNVSDDMYDGFKAIITAHTNNLVFLNNTHREISEQLKSMAQSKTNLSRLVHERLKGVSSLQSKITTVQHKIAGKDGFRAMLLKHKKDMFQLVYLECLAPAYDSYVHEIKRRRSWHRKLLTELQKLRLRLENITSNERKQREKYITEYGIYIPKELISRLPPGVPGIHIDIDGGDEDLPEVEGDFSVDLDWRSNIFGNASDMNLDEEMRKMQLDSKAQSPSSAQQSQLAFSASISEKLRTLQDELERKRKEAKNYKRRVQELETKVSISAFAQSHSPSHSSGDSTKLLESQNNAKRLEDQVQKLETKLKDTELQYQTTHKNLEEELKKKTLIVSNVEEEMAQTNEIILDLRKELQEKQSEANTAKLTVTRLEQEIQRLKDQLQSHDLKTSELSQQISDADMEKKVIAEEKRSFVQQITELSKQKVVLSEKLDQLQKLLSDKEAKEESDAEHIRTLKQQIEDLNIKIKEVTSALEDQISMQKTLVDQIEKGKQELLLLENKLKDSKEREQQFEEAVRQLQETITKLEATLGENRRERAGHLEEIQKLNEQIIELRSTVAQFKESKDRAEEKNNALTAQVRDLQLELESQIDEGNSKENSLHDKIEQMAKEQESLKREFAVVRQTLEDQIENLQSALDERENLAQSETSQKLREQERSLELKQELAKLNGELQKTRGDLEESAKQLKNTEEKYIKRVSDLEEEIKKKEDQIKTNQNESQERFKALSQNSEKETQRLMKEIEELRDKLDKEVKGHATANSDMQKKITVVEQEKNKSDAESGKLKKANEALETEVRDLKNELKKTKEDYEEYQHIVQSLQQDNQKLEENLLSSISVSEFSKKELQDQLETKNRTVKLFEETVKKLSEETKNNNEELKKREATINSLKKNEETVTAKIAQLEKELTQFREGLEIIESTTKSSPVVNNLTVPERVTRILNHWDQTSKGGREIEQHMKAMEKALQEAKEDVKYKEQLISVYRQNSIAMNNFEGGCLVAFRPNRAEFYEIWNIGAPNYYLNPEDEHIFQQEIKAKVVILGFIVALEKRTATEKDNPFKLPVGTDYHLVTAERLGDN